MVLRVLSYEPDFTVCKYYSSIFSDFISRIFLISELFHASHFSTLGMKHYTATIHVCLHVHCIYSAYLCFLLMTDILLCRHWKQNISHVLWQSSKVWFMFQRSNWQHFLHRQAAPVRFLTYLKTLGDIYLAQNCTGWSQIIYLCLAQPLNKEQTCFCG